MQAMPQDPLDELVLDPECRAVSANVACAPAEEPEERAGRGAHVRHPVDRRSRLGIEATVQALAESTRKGLAHHDLVLVVAACPPDGVPDASTRVASESAESVDETAPQLAGERLVASDDVVAVLDVVVERAIDELDLAEREGDAGEPVVVKGASPARRGTASATSRSSRRKSDAAPVTVLIRRSEAQIGVVVGPVRPVRRREQLAVGGHDRHVGVGELDALGVERAREASPACRRARRRPGRRARRIGRREGRARGIARSCGSSRRDRCCRRSGTARPRRMPARRPEPRVGVDASSLTMQTKSRCVCSRIDRICLARRSSAGSYVAMQTAIVGVIGAGTVAGSSATSGYRGPGEQHVGRRPVVCPERATPPPTSDPGRDRRIRVQAQVRRLGLRLRVVGRQAAGAVHRALPRLRAGLQARRDLGLLRACPC